MPAPLYKKALVIGATSGIGEALARKFVTQGIYVIVTGRRKERLDGFVSSVGADKASGEVLDVTDLPTLPAFAARIGSAHPDLDCVVVNAGIQRPFDFSKPSTVNFDSFDAELKTNYTAAVHLTMAFLPLITKQTKGHFVYISATLGLIPTMLRTANYNASKAALHHWILVFREQLKNNEQGHVRVVEVFPPAVQTELHDTEHQPDLKNGREIGMPLPQFTEECYAGLVAGGDQIGIGHGAVANEEGGFEMLRQKAFQEQYPAIGNVLAKFQQ